MNINELEEKFFDKLEREYEEFIKKLEKCEPSVIIDKAYEKVLKEEIKSILENKDFDEEELNVLLKVEGILDKCYDEWQDFDGNFDEKIEYAVDQRIEKIIDEEDKYKATDFSSDTYRGIYYSVKDDCDENKGGYYIEFYRDLQNDDGDVDFDEVLDDMVIHVDDEYEMSYPQKVVEEHIDNLIIELEKGKEESQ